MTFSMHSLASGSKGNVTYVQAGNTRLLIDAGLSGRRVTELLSAIQVLPESLDGILVTHEHNDHIQGVGVMARKYHVPIYANHGTWQAMARKVGEIPPWQRRVFDTGDDFYIGDFAVTPVAISHDAAEPVAFRLYYGARSVAVATDMGYISKGVMRSLQGADLMILESNHDPDMLKNNPCYPETLKRRILGRKGHLSNEACADALYALGEAGLRHVLLGHLSADNNTPALAMDTVESALKARGVQVGREICIDMTWQDRCSERYTIE